MLDFRPICLEDRAWIEPVMQAAAGHGSEFSFVNLYLWGDQRVASVDGTPVFLSNFSGSLTYPWPVGCRDLPGTLELLRQDANVLCVVRWSIGVKICAKAAFMNQAVFRTRIGRDQRVVEEVLIVCRRQIILAQINIPSERERCKARGF